MKLTSCRHTWRNSLGIPLQCAPIPTILRIIVVFAARISPTVQIFATALFIDRALELFRGNLHWTALLAPIFLLGGLIIYNHISSVLSNMCNQFIGNGLRSKYVMALTEKCAGLHYMDIENREIWNLIKRVKNKPDETVQKGMDSVLNLLGIALQSAGFLGALFFQVWWAVPVVVAMAVPIVIFGMRGGAKQYEARRKVAEYERRCEYLEDVLLGREAAEERSLFGYSDFFQNQWKGFYKKARSAELAVTAKWLIRMKTISTLMALLTFAVALTLLYPVSQGSLSVGLFISLVQAANSLVNIMSWELSDNINDYAKYREYLKDLKKFVSLPDSAGALDLPAETCDRITKIEFRDVTFYYPGTQTEVLRHLDLELEEGRHYAMVGKNGAGKTTLIKLLTGLYTEFKGDILINGRSVRTYSLSELKAQMSVLFQDFARYEVSLGDNIALGDMAHFSSRQQEERIAAVMGQLGLEEVVSRFPRGADTPLGKLQEDGQDLSGGQWQRVAMARAVLSPASLLILDEPTAALDPLSESRLYGEFETISRNRTTLFISHRLGSAKLADQILVLDQGKIVQQGTHRELMAQGGLYREMYESQRSWYQ